MFSPDLVTFEGSVSDADWHTVAWRRQDNKLVAALDGDEREVRANFNPYDADLNNVVVVYLGARPFRPGMGYNSLTLVKRSVLI